MQEAGTVLLPWPKHKPLGLLDQGIWQSELQPVKTCAIYIYQLWLDHEVQIYSAFCLMDQSQGFWPLVLIAVVSHPTFIAVGGGEWGLSAGLCSHASRSSLRSMLLVVGQGVKAENDLASGVTGNDWSNSTFAVPHCSSQNSRPSKDMLESALDKVHSDSFPSGARGTYPATKAVPATGSLFCRTCDQAPTESHVRQVC